jgi:hypothetical protein
MNNFDRTVRGRYDAVLECLATAGLRIERLLSLNAGDRAKKGQVRAELAYLEREVWEFARYNLGHDVPSPGSRI